MRRTEALFRLTKQLGNSIGKHQVATRAEQELMEILQSEVSILLAGEDGALTPLTRRPTFLDDPSEQAVSIWTFRNGMIAGQKTDTLPHAKAVYIPLTGATETIGVLAIRLKDPGSLTPDQTHLFETFGAQIALALEREILSDQTKHIMASVEAERLRSTVLTSVSHDFRTPLATIMGEASRLAEAGSVRGDSDVQNSVGVIWSQANRLNRYIVNLLDMTRIESGALKPDRQWNVIEDVIGSAIQNLDPAFDKERIIVNVLPDCPPIMMDSLLIEHVLLNLIENAARYSPSDSPIEIVACEDEGTLRVEVRDPGPGIESGEETRIFEKFYHRDTGSNDNVGAGLGLSICAAIVTLHNGRIRAENREDGGASLIFLLPVEKEESL